MIEREFQGSFGGYKSYLYAAIFNEQGMETNGEKRKKKGELLKKNKREILLKEFRFVVCRDQRSSTSLTNIQVLNLLLCNFYSLVIIFIISYYILAS